MNRAQALEQGVHEWIISLMIRDTFYAFSPTTLLIVAGAILVGVLGFIWLAHRQRKGAEAKLREMANGIGQLRSQREAQLAQIQRKAKRAEQTKDRRSA
jgi:hypothetical protein